MIKKKNIGVIILNYCSYEDTINCINSFKDVNDSNFNVYYAIVDNGSNNNSFDILYNRYKNDNNIELLKLDNNIGFAKGNNYGCDYLRKKYNFDYYIFSNSDILVPKNIFEWIDKTFIENKCDILGPDIFAPKLGIHQNPIKKYSQNKFIINIKLLKKKIELILLKCRIINKKILCINNGNNNDDCSLNKKIYDCPVHGSFIITNNKIFNYYDNFFDSSTFLYMEEYLLYLRCQRNGLKTMVSFDNKVIHLQGKSTDSDVLSIRKKTINRLKKEIESINIYKKMLK